jgi:hypothetical protein
MKDGVGGEKGEHWLSDKSLRIGDGRLFSRKDNVKNEIAGFFHLMLR